MKYHIIVHDQILGGVKQYMTFNLNRAIRYIQAKREEGFLAELMEHKVK